MHIESSQQLPAMHTLGSFLFISNTSGAETVARNAKLHSRLCFKGMSWNPESLVRWPPIKKLTLWGPPNDSQHVDWHSVHSQGPGLRFVVLWDTFLRGYTCSTPSSNAAAWYQGPVQILQHAHICEFPCDNENWPSLHPREP